MGSLAFNSAGLAAVASADLPCGSFWSMFDPSCSEAQILAAWNAKFYNTPTISASKVVAPKAPSDLVNPCSAYEAEGAPAGAAAAQCSQDLSNAAIEQTQQNVQDFFESIPAPDSSQSSCQWLGISCLTWLIGAGVLLVALPMVLGDQGYVYGSGPRIYKRNRGRRGRR